MATEEEKVAHEVAEDKVPPPDGGGDGAAAGSKKKKRRKRKKKGKGAGGGGGGGGDDFDDIDAALASLEKEGKVSKAAKGGKGGGKGKGGGGKGSGSSGGAAAGGGGGGGVAEVAVEKYDEPRKDPPCLGVTGKTDFYVRFGQTEPPTIPIPDLLSGKEFRSGQELEYWQDHLRDRETSAEVREKERLAMEPILENLREAAEVHRQVRAWAQSLLVPGVNLREFCEMLENKNRELVGEKGLERGIAFPTGVSVNHVAAHYTPNPGEDLFLTKDDIISVDFGTQVDGYIIDCAFTSYFDPKFKPLADAAKAATEEGIRMAGVDVTMHEIGEAVKEVMESFEMEIDGEMKPVKVIANLSGHSIERYNIHAGKSVPLYGNGDRDRMEAGEIFAIETFGVVNGRGHVEEVGECSHFMRPFDCPRVDIRLPRARKLLNHINRTFGTLAFCPRWIDRPDGGSKHVHGEKGRQDKFMGALRQLVSAGAVKDYPPLADLPGSFTAQYEHTIAIKSSGKEVISRGDDY